MTEPMMRGLVLVGFREYFQRHVDGATRDRLRAGFSPELREHFDQPVTSRWYPRELFVELNRATASLFTTVSGVLDGLTSAGSCISEVAAGTFLKLLLKMLTPGLFARKFTDFWAHDNRGGRIDVDSSKLDDREVIFHIRDIAGFDHIGPVGRGYIQFAMRSITKKDVDIELSGWSLATPGPAEVHYRVRW
jgi:hypothetical protein